VLVEKRKISFPEDYVINGRIGQFRFGTDVLIFQKRRSLGALIAFGKASSGLNKVENS
jgi:hypothetical protein